MKALAVLALGAAVTIWWLQQREAPAPLPAPQARKPAVVPPPAPPQASPKPAAKGVAAKARPRPAPAPLVLKEIPPREKQATLAPPVPQPVAFEAPQPPAPAPASPPAGDSVHGWGPWTQTASDGAVTPGHPQTPAHNLTHVLPAVAGAITAGGPAPSAGVLPSVDGNVRPGHGWGDQHHVHVHRHHDFRRGRD